MSKFFKISKRMFTLILAAAMVFGQASVSLAAPIDAEEVSDATGIITPGKVQNVGYHDYNTEGLLNKNKISWDYVIGATGYQEKIVDPDGNVFTYLEGYSGGVYEDLSINNYLYSNFTGSLKIEATEGGYKYAEDSDHHTIHMAPGVQYKIYVRAVRVNGTDKTYGPWSDPVSYSFVKTVPVKPTNVHLDQYDEVPVVAYEPSEKVEVEVKDSDGLYYFDDLHNSDIYLIAYSGMLELFDYDDYLLYAYEYKDGKFELYRDSNDDVVYGFNGGKTYTVRLRTYTSDENGKKLTSEWSSPITFQVPKMPVPKVPGLFNLSGKRLSWKEVPNSFGYIVEVKDSKGNLYGTTYGLYNNYNAYIDLKEVYQIKMNSEGKYEAVLDSDGNRIYAGKTGETYNIRVQAWNYSNFPDSVTGEYNKQTSPWSETFVADYKKEYDTVSKVTGVKYYDGSAEVRWDDMGTDQLKNVSYEIEVKDSKGRLYQKVGKDDEGNPILVNYITTNIYASRAYLSNFCFPYVKIDDKYVSVKNSKGEEIKPFTKGESYSVRVRMSADVLLADGVTRETKTGPWSDTMSFVVSGESTESGYNRTPEKITGVWVKDEPFTGESLSIPTIYWNKLNEITEYQVEISDMQGHIFSDSVYISDGKLYPVYYSTTSTSATIRNFKTYKSYILSGNTYLSTLRDSSDNIVYAFEAGQTYRIRVRAVNSYQKKKADGTYTDKVYYFGEWSDYATYTVKNIDYKVKNFKYVKRIEDYYVFDFKADTSLTTLYYQIATKSDFSDASLVYDWKQLSTTKIKDYDYKMALKYSDLEPDTTYYIRVVNSRIGDPKEINIKSELDKVIATAASTSFKTDNYEGAEPKDITGLVNYKEDSTYFHFKFDPVLESGKDSFEVQVNTVSDPNNGNWRNIGTFTSGSTFSVIKSNLTFGDNYIRVCAYVTVNNEKIYGKASNVVKVTYNKQKTSPIGTLSLKEETSSAYVFTYSGNPRLDESISYCYANTSSFSNNHKEDVIYSGNTVSVNVDKTFSVNKTDLKPGKTYYFKARVYNSNATTTDENYTDYSNVVKINTSVPKAVVADKVIKKTSVRIHMDSQYTVNWVSGYEFQRKEAKGKKSVWKTLSKSYVSVYTDKKLKSFKLYSYRIRPYYFDKVTRKFTYGEWIYTEAMPGWTEHITMFAKPISKNSISIKWDKVKGANYYELYRQVASSSYDQIKDGYNNTYNSYELIKTFKAGKKSYVDKKLTPNTSYTYILKAYRKIGKRKVYIQRSVTVSLDFTISKDYAFQKSNGSYKYAWIPVAGAKGYKIEKQDPYTGKWNLYKTINKQKTSSIILPASTDFENGDTYRIYAFKGNEITNKLDISVPAYISPPTNVKAKVTGKKVTISWSPVKGADYYRVWRSTEPPQYYSKDKKVYSQYSGYEVGRYIAESGTVNGYRQRSLDEMNVTSVVDEQILVDINGIQNQITRGPEEGIKYYYYVKAYRYKKKSEYKPEGSSEVISSYISKLVNAEIKADKPAKPVVSKLKSKKKNVTITIKGPVKAEGYEVQRSTKAKKGFKLIGEAKSGASSTYTDKFNKKKNRLKKGKTYYYRVRSYTYNDCGTKTYSAWSKVKKVKLK